MAKKKRKHLSAEEVAAHWNVGEELVRKLLKCGSLKGHKIGRLVRVSPEEIARYERENRVGES
jgi:excisionase family DNA binding protein